MTFRAEKPIKLGATEFNRLMDELNRRREKGEDTTLNAVIMPDKSIWVLPLYFQDGAISQHSIVAEGNPCAWAGEVKIEGNKLVSIRDQSGHFRTVAFDKETQEDINKFALNTFKANGFEVPGNIDLVKKNHN